MNAQNSYYYSLKRSYHKADLIKIINFGFINRKA